MTDDDADIIALQASLAAIPDKYAKPDPATLSKLPKPTKRENEKGKCDVCGGWHGLPAIHIDYMGHADITLALIAIDPFWNWEPAAIDPATGGPMIQRQDGKDGGRLVMWARLNLLGKSILGVGTCETSKGDPEKELIGDFLRNAAMRFGVATALWSKADKADPAGSDAGGGYERQSRQRAPRGPGNASNSGNDVPPPSGPEPAYVAAMAAAKDKGVGYIVTIARDVAKGSGIEPPRNAAAITPALAVLVCEKLGILPRDVGLQADPDAE